MASFSTSLANYVTLEVVWEAMQENFPDIVIHLVGFEVLLKIPWVTTTGVSLNTASSTLLPNKRSTSTSKLAFFSSKRGYLRHHLRQGDMCAPAHGTFYAFCPALTRAPTAES